jgi:hypothetical protein
VALVKRLLLLLLLLLLVLEEMASSSVTASVDAGSLLVAWRKRGVVLIAGAD